MDDIVGNTERTRMVRFDCGKARWFVMRDRSPVIARRRAWQTLPDEGLEVFVPLRQRILTENGRRVRIDVPVIPDLLFVHSTKEILDRSVQMARSLRFRYAKGDPFPMHVDDISMRQFIDAVRSSSEVRYYTPDEITPSMHGRRVRIIGGALNGMEGFLVATRGGNSRKRFLLELPGLLAASVAVEKEHIQLI